jgi:hypothetical protein
MREIRCPKGNEYIGRNRTGLLHIFKPIAKNNCNKEPEPNDAQCLMEEIKKDTREQRAKPICVTCRRCNITGWLQRIDLDNYKNQQSSETT